MFPPLIAGLLASGLEKAANGILSKGKEWVEEKIGIKLDENKNPDPETLLKIKQFEHDYQMELLDIQREDNRLEAEIYKAQLADVASAREREVKIATSRDAPEINKVIVPLLAIGVLLGTFVLFAFVMFGDSAIDASRKEVMIYVLGVMSAISTQVIQYFFGTSTGSKQKDMTIQGLLK